MYPNLLYRWVPNRHGVRSRPAAGLESRDTADSSMLMERPISSSTWRSNDHIGKRWNFFRS